MASITTILGSDNPKDSRTVINTNFSNLNTDKAETSALTSGLATKQATLVSGTNIKTINSNSILGSGDLTISTTVADGSITTTKLGGDITTAGKALLDDADAAAQRATLGLGTLATQSGTFSGTSSGTNTGDETTVTIKSKLGAASTSQSGYLTNTDWDTFNGKQAALGYTAANKAGETFTGAISATNLSGTNTGDQTSIVGITGTMAQFDTAVTDGNIVYQSQALGTPASGTLTNCTVDGTDQVGFRNCPINSQSAAYTLVLSDAGKTIYHPSADTTARTWTIPANSSVAFPVGTIVTFENDISAGALTISITTDTLVLVGAAGTTGSRTLAAGGRAVAQKVTSTRWRIDGNLLT